MLKTDLLKAILEYRNTIVPNNLLLLEADTDNQKDDKEKEDNIKWVSRADIISSPSDDEEKLPGFFSGKKVKVGSSVPSFVNKGEEIGNTFYNKSGKKYNNKEKSKKKTEKEMSEQGTDINDLHILPGYGYATMQYDEVAIKHLNKNNLAVDDNVTSNKWSANDLNLLKQIITKTTPSQWESISVDNFWVYDENIRTGTDELAPVHLFDSNTSDAITKPIPFGFYTHFFTSVSGSEEISKLRPDKKFIKIVSHNEATGNKPLALAVHKLDSSFSIAAARMREDIVILMKIPTQTLSYIKKG